MASKTDFKAKAKEINDSVFGIDRKNKATIEDGLKEQVNENMRYSLGLALSLPWVSAAQKQSLVSILKEEKNSIDLLFSRKKDKAKAAEMLKPIFGANSSKFITAFQENFDALQKELLADVRK